MDHQDEETTDRERQVTRNNQPVTNPHPRWVAPRSRDGTFIQNSRGVRHMTLQAIAIFRRRRPRATREAPHLTATSRRGICGCRISRRALSAHGHAGPEKQASPVIRGRSASCWMESGSVCAYTSGHGTRISTRTSIWIRHIHRARSRFDGISTPNRGPRGANALGNDDYCAAGAAPRRFI
jgi:hypothetical protein